MGRYDGEDYADVARCKWSEHDFQTNGCCHRCRCSRTALVNEALVILETDGALLPDGWAVDWYKPYDGPSVPRLIRKSEVRP